MLEVQPLYGKFQRLPDASRLTNNAITGDSLWLFVLNSPDAGNAGNIDGTCMALFDDDYVDTDGGEWVELVTAPVDVSAPGELQLSFDYNYNNIGADSFVEVWNEPAGIDSSRNI